MIRIDPNEIAVTKLHRTLLGAVAPRPIAFVSTIDMAGNHNLSPFSFFNVFGVNPTTLIFSPSRRGRDNTTKHTYENLKEVPEAVINIVNYNMVQQMSLASTEYDKGVNEFIKAGFTALASETIRPQRVKESPVQLECKVREIIETGDKGGAGNLVICEVLLMHINKNILNEDGEIDQHKIDLVGRLGGDYYCRASGEALFNVEKPLSKKGIGIDRLPEHIRLSSILTGNDLGILGNLESLPNASELLEAEKKKEFIRLVTRYEFSTPEYLNALHMLGKELLESGQAKEALAVLMAGKLS